MKSKKRHQSARNRTESSSGYQGPRLAESSLMEITNAKSRRMTRIVKATKRKKQKKRPSGTKH